MGAEDSALPPRGSQTTADSCRRFASQSLAGLPNQFFCSVYSRRFFRVALASQGALQQRHQTLGCRFNPNFFSGMRLRFGRKLRYCQTPCPGRKSLMRCRNGHILSSIRQRRRNFDSLQTFEVGRRATNRFRGGFASGKRTRRVFRECLSRVRRATKRHKSRP